MKGGLVPLLRSLLGKQLPAVPAVTYLDRLHFSITYLGASAQFINHVPCSSTAPALSREPGGVVCRSAAQHCCMGPLELILGEAETYAKDPSLPVKAYHPVLGEMDVSDV